MMPGRCRARLQRIAVYFALASGSVFVHGTANATVFGCYLLDDPINSAPEVRARILPNLSIDHCKGSRLYGQPSSAKRIYVSRVGAQRFCADKQLRAEFRAAGQTVFSCVLLATDLESRGVYRWRDERGSMHITRVPPPESCESDDCKSIRKGGAPLSDEEQRSLDARLADAESSLEEAYVGAAEREAEREARRAATVAEARHAREFLRRGVTVCTAFADARIAANAEGRARRSLLDSGECAVLGRELPYAVTGEALDGFVPVFIFVETSRIRGWVAEHWIPVSERW